MTVAKIEFTGFVLAGGRSSRMGADKAFLKIDGETFLEGAARKLGATCSATRIVVNRTQTGLIEKLPVGIVHLFDIFENRGPLGGLHTAFLNCQTDFAVVLAVDLPFVEVEIIKFLQKTALEFQIFSAFVPLQTDGRPQPLCAIYKVRNCLKPLENLLNEKKSASVRDFLASIPTHFFQIEQSAKTFFNVNRPADFQIVGSKKFV